MKRYPKILSFEQLSKLNTKRLLAYLKNLNKCEESIALSDYDKFDMELDDNTIRFKESQKWKDTYQNVIYILNNREHIEQRK